MTEHTEIGQWVARGDPVAEVVALDQVEVEAHVLESHVPNVKLGMTARVEISSLPENVLASIPRSALIGEVVRVVPQADLRTRTFPVKVRLDNPLDPAEVEAFEARAQVFGAGGGAIAARFVRRPVPVFKAGMVARVMLPVGAAQQALLVSKDALVLGGPQPLVYVVDLDGDGETRGKARPVRVQLGVAEEGLIQVTGEGIQPGQFVVVHGNERLRPGQDVVIARELDPGATPTVRAIE